MKYHLSYLMILQCNQSNPSIVDRLTCYIYRLYKTYIYVINICSHEQFTYELRRIDWEKLLVLSNTNDNFELVQTTTYDICNKCFPTKTKYVSTKRLKNTWLTTGLLNSTKHKC